MHLYDSKLLRKHLMTFGKQFKVILHVLGSSRRHLKTIEKKKFFFRFFLSWLSHLVRVFLKKMMLEVTFLQKKFYETFNQNSSSYCFEIYTLYVKSNILETQKAIFKDKLDFEIAMKIKVLELSACSGAKMSSPMVEISISTKCFKCIYMTQNCSENNL